MQKTSLQCDGARNHELHFMIAPPGIKHVARAAFPQNQTNLPLTILLCFFTALATLFLHALINAAILASFALTSAAWIAAGESLFGVGFLAMCLVAVGFATVCLTVVIILTVTMLVEVGSAWAVVTLCVASGFATGWPTILAPLTVAIIAAV